MRNLFSNGATLRHTRVVRCKRATRMDHDTIVVNPAANKDRSRKLVFERLEFRNLMAAWINQGPFGSVGGQVEGIATQPVVGAIHAVIAHPTNPDIAYVGSVNGGVWRSSNATAANPTWTTNTDTQSSLSIGALAFDQADPTFQTVWAGNGRFSSYGRIGGARAGLLLTTDGGNSWSRVTGGGVLIGKNISGITANGSTLVVSSNIADSTSNANVGIFRSTNGGSSFTQVNNAASSNGLPFGRSYDLIADPTNPSILYTSLALAPTASDNGVYRSLNEGASWTRVSTPDMDALFTTGTSNVELAAGRSGEVYAAIINTGRLDGLYRSPDNGATWVAMDIPSTNENGIDVGLNPGGTKGPVEGTPDEISGGQGAIHFSIAADPTDPNVVYVGGDRQPRTNGDAGTFPNSIGANNFSGRLFRGDASLPNGNQFVHLTHRNNLGAQGGGTASNSSPHADSRDMVVDANGNLLEVDDGGIYRRTNPQSNTGDWFSVIGNLSVTEIHDIAYDSRSNVILVGTQDNGNASQATSGAAAWNIVSQGDGGDVVIDEVTLAASNQTIRYTSAQNLGSLRRRVYNASGTQISSVQPTQTILAGGAALVPAFRTPLQLNAVAPSSLIIQGSNSTYESLDQANTLNEVGPGRGTSSIEQDAIAYGGRLNGVANPNVLYVGAGTTVLSRLTAGGTLDPTASQPVTTTIRDLVIDPNAYTSIAIATSTSIRWSTNAGSTWSNITGNLLSLTTDIRSLVFVPGVIDTLIAGTARGIFGTSLAELGNWIALGTGFPNTSAFEMEYDATDNILVAGTLSRGAWTLTNTTTEIDTTLPPYDYGDAPASYGVTQSQNGPRHARVGPTLGNLRDAELDGAPSSNASGDNNGALNDEDGVIFTSAVVAGNYLDMQVSAPLGGVLNAWLDIDRNGTFSEGERLIADQVLVAGNNTLSLLIPSNAVAGSSFARFRISRNVGEVTSSLGTANNGEVEDYVLTQLVAAPQVVGEAVINGQAGNANRSGVNSLALSFDANITVAVPSNLRIINAISGAVVNTATVTGTGNGTNNFVWNLSSLALPDGRYVFELPRTAATNAEGTALYDTKAGLFHVLQGDLNGDARVNAADFAFVGSNFSPLPGVAYRAGDANGDGLVRADDFAVVGAKFNPIGLPTVGLDFGDAPEPSTLFPTTLARNGARAIARNSTRLGNSIDTESDGSPSSDASGDGDDEDGVTFSLLVRGGLATATVSVATPSTAYVNAWIDFDRNGNWLEAGEYVIRDQVVGSGLQVLSFSVPTCANDGTAIARVRITSSPGYSFDDLSIDGEIEDYQLTILPAPPALLAIAPPSSLVHPWLARSWTWARTHDQIIDLIAEDVAYAQQLLTDNVGRFAATLAPISTQPNQKVQRGSTTKSARSTSGQDAFENPQTEFGSIHGGEKRVSVSIRRQR